MMKRKRMLYNYIQNTQSILYLFMIFYYNGGIYYIHHVICNKLYLRYEFILSCIPGVCKDNAPG